jgi:hypothetical protein
LDKDLGAVLEISVQLSKHRSQKLANPIICRRKRIAQMAMAKTMIEIAQLQQMTAVTKSIIDLAKPYADGYFSIYRKKV